MSTVHEKSHLIKGGQSLKVRSAQEQDAEAFLSLGKSILAEEIYSLTEADELNLTIEQEKKWIRSHLENPNHLVLVAELNGRLVGQLDFSNGHKKRIAHTGEFGMGVHKDFRGLGIGGLLLQTLIDWARIHPFLEKINLCVHKTNDRAIAVYEKYGFQIEGVRTKDLKYSHDVYVDTVLMGIGIK